MKLSLRSPCPVRPTLTGVGDKTSACALCKKNVHHLTQMTEAQGRAFLDTAKSSDTCVRYVTDSRGNVVFGPQLRRVAAAGLLVFAPVAFADGGDVVASAQAEMNRLQEEMVAVGIDPSDVVLKDSDNTGHADEHATKTAGTEPDDDSEPLMLLDGLMVL